MGIIADAMAAKEGGMSVTGIDGKPTTIAPGDLEDMSHEQLFMLRERNPNNKAAQELLAPYEHQAFAREATNENPLLALPIAVAAPVYAAVKSLGFMTDDQTTKPSLSQVGRGLKGVGQGLIKNFMTRDAPTD